MHRLLGRWMDEGENKSGVTVQVPVGNRGERTGHCCVNCCQGELLTRRHSALAI